MASSTANPRAAPATNEPVRLLESTRSQASEEACIGSCLLDPAAIDTAMEIVKPEHFWDPSLQKLYSVLCDLRNSGRSAIDSVILAEELRQRGLLVEVGGVQRLIELFEAVPHAVHVEYYAGIVREKWRRRNAYAVAGELSALIADPTTDTDEVLSEAETKLCQVVDDSTFAGPASLTDILVETLTTLGSGGASHRYTPTGFAALDQVCSGFPIGGLTVVGARPSTGKSSLMLNCAMRCAQVGTPSMFVSYEQKRQEMAMRAISSVSDVPFTAIFKGQTTPQQNQRIVEESRYISAWPLLLEDSSPPIGQLLGMIRSNVRKHKCKIVIIDYLQLIEPANKREPREQQIASMSRALKRLAMQLDIAIVVASQLNRDVEKRENKKPRLADLRESGAIEQDADLVWLLWRPNYDAIDGRTDDYGQVVVAKQRNGPLKDVDLGWNGPTMTYRDSLVDTSVLD